MHQRISVAPSPAARARELLVQATIVACMIWGLTAFDASSGPGRGRLSGLPIGTDFVNFYAMAHIGQSGRYEDLASFESFRAEQQRLVPGAADTPYPPVYPPQVALVMSPLARLSYGHAYLAWIGVTLVLYGASVAMMLRGCPHVRLWPRQVAAIAVASPALWLVVMHGQVSAVGLVALVGMWLALRARRPWVAGGALGLLAFKPSLFVPALILLAASGEWRMAAGASLGAVVQYALVIPWAGVSALLQYVAITLDLLRSPDLVASNPPLMHSLRTFWAGLVRPPIAPLAYGVTAIVVVGCSAVAWRRLSDALARTAIMSVVVVLTSPHLFAYDLLILTPLLLASSERVVAMPEQKALRVLAYAGFFVPAVAIPISALGFQASSVVLAAWLVAFASASSQSALLHDSARRRHAPHRSGWGPEAARTDVDHRSSWSDNQTIGE